MSILGFLFKDGKVERFEKVSKPKIIPFEPKKGLENLKLIDISRPRKKCMDRSANRMH